MFTWLSLALALIKFVNNIMNWISREELMKAGADAEIARIALAIQKKTETGKKIWERIDALSENDVDAELRGLEPK